MKSISISKFKQLKVEEIKSMGSFNLEADGMFVAVIIVPASAEKKAQFQALAEQGNLALGLE